MHTRRDGHYDERGCWKRTKFCFVSCGDRCTCGPPGGAYYNPQYDKSLVQQQEETKMTTIKGEISGDREANMLRICEGIVAVLKVKNVKYGDSWKAKGGFSAFFNLDRKWSRVENLAKHYNYDIFAAIRGTASEPDGMLDALGDLMGYIVLTLDETVTGREGQMLVKTGDKPL